MTRGCPGPGLVLSFRRTSWGQLMKPEWGLWVKGSIFATSLKLFQNQKEKGNKRNSRNCAECWWKDLCVFKAHKGRSFPLHSGFLLPAPGIIGHQAPLRHLYQKDAAAPLGGWLGHRGHRWVVGEEGICGGKEPSEVIILHMVVNNATLSLLNRGRGKFGLWERTIMQIQADGSF